MKMPPFAYGRAASLSELFALWTAAGHEAKILAGGQSLLATLAFRLSEPSALIDITGIEALKGISATRTHLRLGALATHAEIGASDLVARHAPLMAEAVPFIAHPAIRNRGTLGGSLAFADPAAEWPAVMVALDASLTLASASGERVVAAEKFFRGLYDTALKRREIIAAVEVQKQRKTQRTALVEVARRSGDYAMAGLALSLDLDGKGVVSDARPVFFALGDRPVLAKAAAKALIGKPLDPRSVATAQAALERDLDPPADIHGGPAMKLHLARVLLARAAARIAPGVREAA
jgi:carbon-monoxide dehydrogenase medium subunit